LTVFANFTPGTGSGPTGQSETITVKTVQGTLVAQETVNAPSGGGVANAPTIKNLPNANLYVHVALYSGVSGSGTIAGSLDTVINGNSAAQITTAMAQPTASVVVNPGNAQIVVNGTVQLEAAAEDGNGELVFQNQATSWSVGTGSSGVVSVSSSGLVTGLSAGDGTLLANIGGTSGSDQVIVSTSAQQETWTVMVYMTADNDLDSWSQTNITQLEKIAQQVNSPTRFVVQWKLSASNTSFNHPFNGTRRYVVTKGGLYLAEDLGDGDTVDMGQPSTLQTFVNWTYQNYPAQHYALVMWDHGNGWEEIAARARGQQLKFRAISYDGDTQNAINIWDLPGALGNHYLDVLSFDACLMQMLEVEDEVATNAHYMVCGEDNTPDPGYPYDLSFGDFVSSPTAATATLAKGITAGFFQEYAPGTTYSVTPLSQSVVDLTKVSAVTSAVSALSNALIAAGTPVATVIQNVRTASLCYDSADAYYYYDLTSICKRLAANSSTPAAVKTAATNVVSAVAAAVVSSTANSNSPDSNGISIEFGNYGEFNGVSSSYGNLTLAAQTNWAKFLDSSTLNP